MEMLLAFLILVGTSNAFFFMDPAFQLSDKTMMDNPFWKNFEKGMKQIEASLKVPNDSATSEDSEGDYSESTDVGFEEPLIPNIFSMISNKPWWRGKNVCVTKEETDLSESQNATTEATPSFFNSLTTRTEACSSTYGRYECVTSVRGPGKHVKTTVRYECCEGHQRRKNRCEFVKVLSLLETAKESAPEFSRMLETTGMMDKLLQEEGNYTFFLPGDEIMDDLQETFQEMNQVDLKARRLRHISHESADKSNREGRAEFSNANPALNKVLMNHVVKGSFLSFGMQNNEMLTTVNGDKLRINVYPQLLSKVVTINCARITSGNKAADRGVVHMVDGVLRPVERSVAQIIQEDERFTIFRSLLEKNGLLEKLNEEGITVFAPTDDAFKQLSPEVYDGECSGRVASHHLSSVVLCLSALPDQWIVQSLAGEMLNVRNNPADGITVDENAKVTQKDVVGTNGVVHVLDKAIIPDSAKTLSTAFDDRNLTTFKSLLEEAGMLENSMGSHVSWFAPREMAFESTEAKAYLESVRSDKDKLKDMLLFHSTQPEVSMQNISKGDQLPTRIKNQSLRFGVNYMPTMFNNMLTANCALVRRTDTKACGVAIHEVDRILIPPSSDVMGMIRDRPELSTLNKIIQKAGMEEYLKETDGITLLAPSDEAFNDLTVRALNTFLDDPTEAKKLVEQHILTEPVCCKSISGDQWFWRQEVTTKSGRRLHARRDFNNHVHIGGTRLDKCDQIAFNGVVHNVNKVLSHQRNVNGHPFGGMSEIFKHSSRNPNMEVLLYGI